MFIPFLFPSKMLGVFLCSKTGVCRRFSLPMVYLTYSVYLLERKMWEKPMKSSLKYVMLPLVLLLLVACTGPRVLTKHGLEYEESKLPGKAYESYSRALKKKPNFVKALSGLKRTGSQLIDKELSTFTAMVNKKEYRSAVGYYESALSRKKEISSYNLIVSWPADIDTKYRKAKAIANRQIAEEHYGIASKYENERKFRKAYYSYVTSSKADSKFKDVVQKCEEMLDSAKVHIAFVQGAHVSSNLIPQITETILKKQDPFVEVVDRSQLNQILKEHELSLTGVIDEASAVEVGKILGIHALVLVDDIFIDKPEDRWSKQKMLLYKVIPRIVIDTTELTDTTYKTISVGKVDTIITKKKVLSHYIEAETHTIKAVKVTGSRAVEASASYKIILMETAGIVGSGRRVKRAEDKVVFVDCGISDYSALSSKIPLRKKISSNSSQQYEIKSYIRNLRLPFKSKLFNARRHLEDRSELKNEALNSLSYQLGKDIYKEIPER